MIRDVLRRIISGGQAGADRAALDFALESRIETGGCVPLGRRAEDGVISKRYRNLVESTSADPAERTRSNVLDSDATLIFSFGELSGGTLLTREIAQAAGREHLNVDLRTLTIEAAVEAVSDWLNRTRPMVLNVAGPRASEASGIYSDVLLVLRKVRDEQEKAGR